MLFSARLCVWAYFLHVHVCVLVCAYIICECVYIFEGVSVCVYYVYCMYTHAQTHTRSMDVHTQCLLYCVLPVLLSYQHVLIIHNYDNDYYTISVHTGAGQPTLYLLLLLIPNTRAHTHTLCTHTYVDHIPRITLDGKSDILGGMSVHAVTCTHTRLHTQIE